MTLSSRRLFEVSGTIVQNFAMHMWPSRTILPRVGPSAQRLAILVWEPLLQDHGRLHPLLLPRKRSRYSLPCKCWYPALTSCMAYISTRPEPDIGVLLPMYDFANANKVFCLNLVTLQADKSDDPPLSAYLSLTSYLLQHAHRSTRAALYTYLSLFILQILVEDQLLVKRLCSDDNKISVRLCRQRQPFLPLVKGDRVPISVILDLMLDGINHNLRRRLDVELYMYVLSCRLPSYRLTKVQTLLRHASANFVISQPC